MMKRIFNISVKRSCNFQSVEISEGFENEFDSDADFEQEKKTIIWRVHKTVQEQLDKLNEAKFDLRLEK